MFPALSLQIYVKGATEPGPIFNGLMYILPSHRPKQLAFSTPTESIAKESPEFFGWI
jgi:hypothetical protein